MQGLASDIKLALDTVISGLEYKFLESDLLNPEKMQVVMKSKVSSFNSAKDILMKWSSSPNAPTKEVLINYIGEVVEAGDKALITLRHALRQEINFSNLDATSHNQAITAKSFILESVFDLDKSLVDLRNKLEEGNLDLSDKEFRLGYPEVYAKKKDYEIGNYFKDWYNKETDGVNICPHSTKGKTIILEDLYITLPKEPEDKTTILFHDLGKEEQYWRRQHVPENINPDNVELWDEYIKEEYRRRREGIWFYNNGEATYLTGHHYFALQWCVMLDNGGYMDFRYAQLNMFYHMQACITDKRCLGQLFVKSRRTGFTYAVICIVLNMATTTANAKYGMTSKSGDDVQEAFDKLSYMFLSLPFYFRPVVKGKEDSPSELFFGKPSNNSKEAKKTRDTGIKDYLNTSIDHRPTKNDSYDSVKLNGYIGDECVSPETKVLMEDLTWKEAQHIKVGDKVMSGDGSVQSVVKTGSGTDDMYRVVEPYGKDYVVNSRHKLLLNQGGSKSRTKNISITAPEYLKLSDYKKGVTRARKWDGVQYSHKDLEVDPYVLGAWLGDGFSEGTKFVFNHRKDKPLMDYIENYFNSQEDFLPHVTEKSDNWCKLYIKDLRASGNNQYTDREHRFKKALKELGVWGNKRIPKKYLFSSREQRLALLAGILNTDGYKKKGVNSYSIGMSRRELLEDIRLLCMTLGISVSNITHYMSNIDTCVYRLNLSPVLESIPVLLDRKKTNLISNNTRVKIDVQYEGAGKYVGFEITPNTLGEHTWVGESNSLISNCSKWVKPHDYITHLGMVAPTMMPNGKVVGKAFLGSTMGSRAKGGDQMVELIEGSRVNKRNNVTKKTSTGLYMYFLPAQDNMEEYTDKYGKCHTERPKGKVYNISGGLIETGSVEYLLAVEEQKKEQSDKALNEQLRTYPRTLEHALRDEDSQCVFNINKLYEQIDYNQSQPRESLYTTGNFKWKDGIKDGDVEFYPDDNGRFNIAWMPSKVDNTEELKNRVKKVGDKYYPLNLELVRFGNDPFSLKSTNGKGSNGATHGKTIMNPEGGAPPNKWVLEYIARPSDETIFFEDVIMCCRFYGSPILVESNRIDLLRHMRNRGYRGFAIDRVDVPKNKRNPNQIEYGGQVMSSKDILDSHLNSIGMWIEHYVGVYNDEDKQLRPLGEMGDMPFTETLKDWLAFNPDKRTDHDATISSGLAIMACHQERYRKKTEKPKREHIKTLLKKYNNSGSISRLTN